MTSALSGYTSLDVLGFDVFTSKLDIINPGLDKILINTFSPNSYGISTKDRRFKDALKGSDILVLDGMGIAIGSILLHGKNIRKIAGQDCFDYLINQANINSWKVFFLGSCSSTLEKIKVRIEHEYCNVKVSGFAPPFKDNFSEEDNGEMLRYINSFHPDVLFIGMTAPKQEKWAFEHKDSVNARIISTIGNVFDWYAGNSKRPARIWIKLRLEWFVRIIMRPNIFKRNIKNQLVFFRDLILHVFLIKQVK